MLFSTRTVRQPTAALNCMGMYDVSTMYNVCGCAFAYVYCVRVRVLLCVTLILYI